MLILSSSRHSGVSLVVTMGLRERTSIIMFLNSNRRSFRYRGVSSLLSLGRIRSIENGYSICSDLPDRRAFTYNKGAIFVLRNRAEKMGRNARRLLYTTGRGYTSVILCNRARVPGSRCVSGVCIVYPNDVHSNSCNVISVASGKVLYCATSLSHRLWGTREAI